jgi:hypothetical protein
MTARDDLDRQLDAFLRDGPIELPEPSFYAVRDRTQSTRQRVVIGPWRLPDMNKLVPFGLGVAAVVVALVIGSQFLRPAAAVDVGGSPSAPPTLTQPPDPASGTVRFLSDGVPTTTEVDAVFDGASVSGTAVTTFGRGTHTVRLECAARDGDTWAYGGTIAQTTVPGERAGGWSAVIVKDGSPQQIGIWLSDSKSQGTDCAGWLAAIDLSTIGAESFTPVESGALVPPPDPGP